MSFPYNGNIPQPGDIPANSQPIIQTNFSSIQSLVDIDHVDFAASTPGQHNKVSLKSLGNYPGALPVFNPLGQIGLFSAVDSTTSLNELYINKTNFSGVVQVAATESILGKATPTFAGGGATSQGWTMLPSGIKLSWGVGTGNGASSAGITLSLQYAMAATILNVMVTPINPQTSAGTPFICQVTNVNSANSFYVNFQKWNGANWVYCTNANSFYYLAIGY